MATAVLTCTICSSVDVGVARRPNDDNLDLLYDICRLLTLGWTAVSGELLAAIGPPVDSWYFRPVGQESVS